jgi:hypothetical protein
MFACAWSLLYLNPDDANPMHPEMSIVQKREIKKLFKNSEVLIPSSLIGLGGSLFHRVAQEKHIVTSESPDMSALHHEHVLDSVFFIYLPTKQPVSLSMQEIQRMSSVFSFLRVRWRVRFVACEELRYLWPL